MLGELKKIRFSAFSRNNPDGIGRRNLPVSRQVLLGSATEIVNFKNFLYSGNIVTITLLYCVKAGVPLSVTLKIKCAVSGFFTFGAVNPTP